jgi:hypothetical protein
MELPSQDGKGTMFPEARTSLENVSKNRGTQDESTPDTATTGEDPEYLQSIYAVHEYVQKNYLRWVESNTRILDYTKKIYLKFKKN